MSKLTISGLIFVLLGLTSMYIQNTYYGYVDESGVLRDSIFLPLAFALGFIGVCLLSASLLKRKK